MKNKELQFPALGDPRLAVHATSAFPVWLWSVDGTRIMWANPAGADVFGAQNGATLAQNVFGPADARRRQVIQLAGKLPPNGAVRLERLRGFGGRLGMLVTCACAKLDFTDDVHGILIAAAEAVIPRQIAPISPEPAITEPRSPQPAEAINGSALNYEQPAMSGEAPVEFALMVEFAGEPAEGAPQLTSASDGCSLNSPQQPLRFMWQMDADTRFSVGTDEFTRLIGTRTAAGFGRRWAEIAEGFGLDPESRVLKAVATRDTWNGIALEWPVDGGDPLSVELSGLPIYDRAQNFVGYRGFGVCRDLDALTRLAELRSFELATATQAPLSADVVHTSSAQAAPAEESRSLLSSLSSPSELPGSIAAEPFKQHTDLDVSAETPRNVVPFRPIGDAKSPGLTLVENNAFNELARQLSARLGSKDTAPDETKPAELSEAVAEPPAMEKPEPTTEVPEWLAQPEPPARGETRRDKALLDLLPVGVLIYRLDRLLYANAAFLQRMGYASLHALEAAGGLDALYVEPGVSSASSTSDTGTPVTISTGEGSPANVAGAGISARLYTIAWDDDAALALIFSADPQDGAAAVPEPRPAMESSPVGHANAEELGAILDTTAEGVVMFDGGGKINTCNRSAEALFGYEGDEMAGRDVRDLFAPESQRVVLDYVEAIKGTGVASMLDHGREVLGRTSRGGLIPISMTMGRTQPDGPNFFAVFRDLSQIKKSESELQQAQRLADRAADAKADALARISHEIRTPLNAIIGFAEVMIGERFGALANERYVEYLKDIRASGERVIAIVNDMVDLSHIETGKLELAFTDQKLNELVEQCVAVMQPQANRGRIIVRTSLAHSLPPVFADPTALRHITLNLIATSIDLANAGGQVIVSTALSDFGEVVLRVRDTGDALKENEIAAAMQPFRTQPPSDQALAGSAANLSLTKALVEANRAQFHIRTGSHPGTLIEVAFSHAMTR